MRPRLSVAGIDRRDLVLGGGAAAAVAALLAGPARADERSLSKGAAETLSRILGEGTPTTDGRLAIDVAEIAENGNTVPYTVGFDSPMTQESHVKALHVLSTANPQPAVATFHFTPLSGKAQVASRMRLARSQEIVVVAELSDGRFVVGRRLVKVTIGGCGG